MLVSGDLEDSLFEWCCNGGRNPILTRILLVTILLRPGLIAFLVKGEVTSWRAVYWVVVIDIFPCFADPKFAEVFTRNSLEWLSVLGFYTLKTLATGSCLKVSSLVIKFTTCLFSKIGRSVSAGVEIVWIVAGVAIGRAYDRFWTSLSLVNSTGWIGAEDRT